MREYEYDSWFDFVKHREAAIESQSEKMGYPSYFRGQPNSIWPLKTTLERYTGINLTVATYSAMIEEILPEIETFTNKIWALPSRQDFLDNLAKISHRVNVDERPELLAHFYYMSYLRHFGFPSPLLDWTNSPYIAAYFAYKDITSDAKSVAIYSKMEAEDADPPSDLKTEIYPVYTKSRNNTRHYLQQSMYTICLKLVDDKLIFASYEEPNLHPNLADPDRFIIKYILPAKDRAKALYSLDAYNINAYSLFGTEESLLETLSMRKYIATQKNINTFRHVDPASFW